MPPPLWPFSINRNSPQANGLVAWWPWTASRANVWRDLVAGVNMAPTNSPTQKPAGELGWCTSLVNASSQSWSVTNTNLNNVIAGNTQFTITAWLRQPSANANRWAFSKYSTSTFTGMNMRVDANTLFFQMTDTGGTTRNASKSYTVPTNQWYLYSCGMRANQSAFIKVDWLPSTSTDLSAYTFGSNTHPARAGGAANFWNGDIAEIRVYNRGLSDAELTAIYRPATRWDLYWQSRRRYYYSPAVAGFQAAWARNANSVIKQVNP